MSTVGIIGAGTMGAGIAQIAAAAGWQVVLSDVSPEVTQRGIANIRQQYDKLVEKGRLSAAERDAAAGRLTAAAGPRDFADCELVIEAVIEDSAAKVEILAPIVAAASQDAIIASNTSSLSISKLAAALEARRSDSAPHNTSAGAQPLSARFVGMHFFNPVPLMPLVEVIAGEHSTTRAIRRTAEIARAWGKTVVHARDTPGFIVNRVARGYYLESLRMLSEGVAGIDEIDRILKNLAGFRMGPFELMDLIGIDVNYSVTCSVWEQMGRPARLAPHAMQRELVEKKHLGRKTKRGFYGYSAEGPALPAVLVERQSFELPPGIYKAVRRVFDGAIKSPDAPGSTPAPVHSNPESAGSITEQYVVARVLAAIINEAALALDEGVATAEDIDIAMRLGTNYPRGPLAWAEQIGRHTTAALLRALDERAADGRFRPADWLNA